MLLKHSSVSYSIFYLLNCRFQLIKTVNVKLFITHIMNVSIHFPLYMITQLCFGFGSSECLIQMINYLCAKDKTAFHKFEHHRLLFVKRINFRDLFSLTWAEGSRWAYRMGLDPASVRPSACASVRASVHTFRLEYLWDQPADHNQISFGASLGWGIGCIRFWARLNQNSGFHGSR